MFAREAFLGVRPANKVAYYLIASPAGAYFKGGVQPVSIWLSEDYARAGRGGTGAAKTGGNYASSLLPQSEAYEHERSEEHTSELQSLMHISYAVFCLKKKKIT